MLQDNEKENIKTINSYFSKLEDLYSELSEETKENIRSMHIEDASLPYCIRWGSQAAKDICYEYKI